MNGTVLLKFNATINRNQYEFKGLKTNIYFCLIVTKKYVILRNELIELLGLRGWVYDIEKQRIRFIGEFIIIYNRDEGARYNASSKTS